MSERFKDARETISRLAKESFADHVLTSVGVDEWRCARPGSWMYGFYVIARPGYLIVYGDIGDWILQHSDRDCVDWLRRAARDYEYLCGKIRAGSKKRFYEDDARAYLAEQIADGNSQAAAVKDALEDLGRPFDRHDWFEAWSEVGVGCNDVSDCMGWDSGPLWMSEAVKWFAANLPKPVNAETPRAL